MQVQYTVYSTVQYSAVQYSTVQYSTVQCSTVQYSTVQYSTVQYSTVQYSIQYNTIQYNTIQYTYHRYTFIAHFATISLSSSASSHTTIAFRLGRELFVTDAYLASCLFPRKSSRIFLCRINY